MAFHYKGGWYWERLSNGSVRLFHLQQDSSVGVELKIDSDSWASIVASVSRSGETGEQFQLAKALHGG